MHNILHTMRINLSLLLSLITFGCGSSAPKNTPVATQAAVSQPELITALKPSYRETFRKGDRVKIEFTELQSLDSTIITINGVLAPDGVFTVTGDKVGRVAYSVKALKGEQEQTLGGEFWVVAAKPPLQESIAIVKRYPHDKKSYTQGLLFHNGLLYESVGQRGRSAIQAVEIESGKIVKKKELDKKYFGEGVALLGGKLYQLTWEEGVVFVYDVEDFDKVSQYPLAGEGWGITTDGTWLYLSDGSHKIYKYDPDGFKKISQIEVVTDSGKVDYINELEWIDGKIWANIYLSNNIVVIDPQSGMVERVIDCSILERNIGNRSRADVLNGIAYNPATKQLWLTGKDWDTLFEVKVVR